LMISGLKFLARLSQIYEIVDKLSPGVSWESPGGLPGSPGGLS
jgi:hypothetical protein